MNIIGILCITLAINSWGKAMFDLDTYPAWANATGVWGRFCCRVSSTHALPPSSPTGTRRREPVGAARPDIWADRRGPTVVRRVPRGSLEPRSAVIYWGRKKSGYLFLFLLTLYNSKDMQNIYMTLYCSAGPIFRWIYPNHHSSHVEVTTSNKSDDADALHFKYLLTKLSLELQNYPAMFAFDSLLN